MLHKAVMLTAVMSLALTASAARAAGPWALSVYGGAGVPTGDFADEKKADAQTGYIVGGAVDYQLNDKFALGVDGSWNQNKSGQEGKTIAGTLIDKDKFKTFQIGAHGKYMFPAQNMPLHSWLLLGLGAYNTKEDYTETPSGGSPVDITEKFDTKFGGKFGLGATWKANDVVGIAAEVDYNFISEDKDKAGISSAQYVGIQGGLNFTMPHGK